MELNTLRGVVYFWPDEYDGRRTKDGSTTTPNSSHTSMAWREHLGSCQSSRRARRVRAIPCCDGPVSTTPGSWYARRFRTGRSFRSNGAPRGAGGRHSTLLFDGLPSRLSQLDSGADADDRPVDGRALRFGDFWRGTERNGAVAWKPSTPSISASTATISNSRSGSVICPPQKCGMSTITGGTNPGAASRSNVDLISGTDLVPTAILTLPGRGCDSPRVEVCRAPGTEPLPPRSLPEERQRHRVHDRPDPTGLCAPKSAAIRGQQSKCRARQSHCNTAVRLLDPKPNS